MSGLTATMLSALLVALGPGDDGDGANAEVSAGQAASEDALVRAGALWDEASARFEIPDYEGAVELYEEVYLLLVQSGAVGLERELADLQRSLAQACVLAHELTGDVRYLQRARIIWGRLLAEQRRETRDDTSLGLGEGIAYTTWRQAEDAIERPDGDDERSRERSELELELVYVEELLAGYEAEREVASARQRDIAEAARRQLVEDQRMRDEAAQAELRRRALIEVRSKRARRELIAGGTLTGLAFAGFGVMAGALARGAQLERQGHQAREDPQTPDARFDELIAAGARANSLALATGVLAGLSGAVGVGLLIHGGVLRGAEQGGQLAVGPGGLEVHF